MSNVSYIVSTDLDGTLLDHHDYSWHAAQAALELCHKRQIPVIINTSKAASEVVTILGDLGFSAPFIVENGSALIIPRDIINNVDCLMREELRASMIDDHVIITFGTERDRILEFINLMRDTKGWCFEGFSDWSIEQISQKTGLSLDNAQRASFKKYSEPFVWNDTQANLVEFKKCVAEAGFRCMQGGRFFHIQGQTTKAQPLMWLKNNLSYIIENVDGNSSTKLICLGDNHNDVDMLNIADYPVCIRSPVAQYPELTTSKTVIYTHYFGPKGWDEAINAILRPSEILSE